MRISKALLMDYLKPRYQCRIEEDCKYLIDTHSANGITIIQRVHLNHPLEAEVEKMNHDYRKYLENCFEELKDIACSNCQYHDYEEFTNSDGDYREFEVCRKDHDLHEGVCLDYEGL